MRSKLNVIYGDEVFKTEIDILNDTDLAEMAENLRNGIPIATPVFDGANEDDINDMLTKAGLDTSGQMTMIDGRTGEVFARKVTVGYIYILKLHHLS